MKKLLLTKVFALLGALVLAVAPLSVLAVSADSGTDIMQNTRYNPLSPFVKVFEDTANDMDNGILKDALSLLSYGAESLGNAVNDLYYFLDTSPDKGAGFSEAVMAQRALDLVEYAKISTGQPAKLPNSFQFTAKRRIVYPSNVTETDYLYYWWSDDNTLHGSPITEGVSLGNFFLVPNTFVVFRTFSNGDSSAFYGDCHDFPVYQYGGQYLRFQPLQNITYGVYNSDGVYESITLANNFDFRPVNFQSRSTTTDGKPATNSITTLELLNIKEQNPSRYSQFWNDSEIFTNIECMLGGAFNDSGVPMFTANSRYRDSQNSLAIGEWVLSGGGFFGSFDTNWINTINNNFNTSPDDIVPYKSPVYYSPDNPLNSPNMLTPETVNNYYDYGITYDTDNDSYDIDPTLLLAGAGAAVQPTLDPVFDNTFDAQPEINGDFSGELPLDMNNDFGLTLKDLLDVLRPSSGTWEPPSYPAVNTSAFIPATYPTFEVSTIPPDYGEVLGESLTNGWDMADGLGLTAILVPFTILILLWRFTGK